MTEADRLRAALRLILIPARRWVDGCPHAPEEFDGETHYCVEDDGDSNLCDGCCVDITAASRAAAAVGLAMSPSDRRDPEIRARALAIVRDAGLADMPERCGRCGHSRDRHNAFFCEACDDVGAHAQQDHEFEPLAPDPHAAAPGDVLEVAEVEDFDAPDALTRAILARGGHVLVLDETTAAEAHEAIRAQHPDIVPRLPEITVEPGAPAEDAINAALRGSGFRVEMDGGVLNLHRAPGGPPPFRRVGPDTGDVLAARIRAQHPDEARVAVAREFADLLREHPECAEAFVSADEHGVTVETRWTVLGRLQGVKVQRRRYKVDDDALAVARAVIADEVRVGLALERLAKWEVK